MSSFTLASQTPLPMHTGFIIYFHYIYTSHLTATNVPLFAYIFYISYIGSMPSVLTNIPLSLWPLSLHLDLFPQRNVLLCLSLAQAMTTYADFLMHFLPEATATVHLSCMFHSLMPPINSILLRLHTSFQTKCE